MNGFGRGGGYRGGFSRGGYQQSQSRPPFAMAQPIPPPPPEHSPTYYTPPPPQQSGTTYFHPAGYEPYAYATYPPPVPVVATTPTQPAPPVPLPVTPISFPLDPTRYYLLGQLEYYLSAQNLAQDFFLRQQIDNRGWIPIPLIASFNRVRQLTPDLQLVKDVLTLSTQVEVTGDWVRIHQWERYVLPTALHSVVEGSSQHIDTPNVAEPHLTSADDGADTASTSHEGDEDDEDDVEFVLGKDANRSWTPERTSG